MTEIEKEALALENEVRKERGYTHMHVCDRKKFCDDEILCRAIEARKAIEAEFAAFKQEVSDAVERATPYIGALHSLNRFIIAKLDPLADVLTAVYPATFADGKIAAKHLRQALAARGLKIVEQDQ